MAPCEAGGLEAVETMGLKGLDRRQRDRLAEAVLGELAAAVAGSSARLRGSLAGQRADAYSDVDVRWVVLDAQFLAAVERAGPILTAVRPVESLRSDPLLQRSQRHRLLFDRFADVPLFWRLDLELFARSAEHDHDGDLDNPGAGGTDWSLPESALANAVAAVKASLRQQDAIAEALLARAFERLHVETPAGDVGTRVRALAAASRLADPSLANLAARVEVLAQERPAPAAGSLP